MRSRLSLARRLSTTAELRSLVTSASFSTELRFASLGGSAAHATRHTLAHNQIVNLMIVLLLDCRDTTQWRCHMTCWRRRSGSSRGWLHVRQVLPATRGRAPRGQWTCGAPRVHTWG